MRKFWMMLSVICVLTAGTAFALEAHTPINDEVVMQLPSGGPASNADYDIEVTGSLTTGSDVWFAAAEDSGVTSLMLCTKRPWSKANSVDCVYDGKDMTEFTYHFLEPGDYTLFASDASSGDYICIGVYTVTGDDLLAQRVSEIMADCPLSDDYGVALWAHDWLTLHTYYDSTTTYHGPDYLLTEGWGVCQSYATAYYMMLESKGISAEYISSSEIGHAWNAVCLDGKWYEADVTWDTVGYDAYGEGSPASYNHHMYFLLPDYLFQTLRHTGQDDKYETQCVSMDLNYYVQSGYAESWLNDSIESELNLKLTDASETVTVAVDSQPEYISEYSYYPVSNQVCAAALAQILNGTERTAADESVYTLSASSDGSSLTVTATKKGIDYSGLDTLSLPEDLTVIGSEAFVNTAAQVIIIPADVTEVSSDAFNGCVNLQYIVNRSSLTITPPDGVTLI